MTGCIPSSSNSSIKVKKSDPGKTGWKKNKLGGVNHPCCCGNPALHVSYYTSRLPCQALGHDFKRRGGVATTHCWFFCGAELLTLVAHRALCSNGFFCVTGVGCLANASLGIELFSLPPNWLWHSYRIGSQPETQQVSHPARQLASQFES